MPRLVRLITVAALLVLAALSWAWLAKSEAVMASMRGQGLLLTLATAMMEPATTVPYLAASGLMWVVMMSAMMTPAVLPVVLVFQRLERRRGGASGRLDGGLFALGYLLVWSGFALVATVAQWGLHRTALLHSHALATGPSLAAGIFVAAGAYQLTPIKAACLRHCQAPVPFLLSNWRDGAGGALRMGMRHGSYCVGCCWVLMLLMFVAGVMSVAAMAILSLFVLGERLLPPGPWSAKAPGVILIAWGVWTWVAAHG